MEQKNGNKHSTPIPADVKSSNNGAIPKQIQINLSKEYFASLANEEEILSSGEDKDFKRLSGEISPKQIFQEQAEKDSDGESGITPIIHDESPIKGIIRSRNPDSPGREMMSTKDSNVSPTMIGSPSRNRSPRATKKVRITEPEKEASLKSAQSITEIEGIRTQLKHMIELTKVQNTSGYSQLKSQENKTEPESTYLDDGHQTYGVTRKPLESMTSLRGMLSYTSPPLQMDEHGIMRGPETEPFSSIDRTSRDFISPSNDTSLLLENSMLKESLGMEKQRRKHLESQIQNLQKKVLEMQQQLAVAVATDRKKAIMIEQLDKTLANIVAGWKKQDADKIKTIQKLRDENSVLRKSQHRHQELLQQFEKELAQAVESLTKEQAKTKSAEQEKQDEIKRHQELKEEAYEKLQEERAVSEELKEEREKLLLEKNELNKHLNDLEEQTEEERDLWKKETQELNSAAEEAKARLTEEINQLKDSLSSAQRKMQEADSKVSEKEHDIHSMQLELDVALREKESLKVEVSLLEAKFESLKSKQESEQRAILEEEFNKKINVIQDEIMRTETQLKTTHKEQILDLNQRHKEDLELQLRRFHEEINKRESQIEILKKDFETRFSESQDEIQALKDSQAKLEAHRKELTRRLQSLMQQHIQEAVSLISLENGSQTPSSQQVANAINLQMLGLKNMPFPSVPQEGNRHDSIPLSSTLTELNSSKQRESVGRIQSSESRPFQTSGSQYFERAEPRVGLLSEENGGTSSFEAWSRLGQANSLLNGASKEVLFKDMNAPPGVEDSFLWREQQFQSGLQHLSDKLKLSRNEYNSGQWTEEQRPAFRDEAARSHRKVDEEKAEHSDNWLQIQDILKSKLDEVTQTRQSQGEHERRVHEQAVHDSFRGVFNQSETKLDYDVEDHEVRQSKLTGLIKRLLNKSPGNPTEDETDEEYDTHYGRKKEMIPPNTRSIQNSSIKHKMKTFDERAQLDSLPVGSDSVSKDSVEGNLKTPPKASRTSSLVPAFKKSVLKDRPVKPSFSSDPDMAYSPRKSPHNAIEKMASVEVDPAKQQLIDLMKALGIQKETSADDLEEMIKMIAAFQKGQSSQKQQSKGGMSQGDPSRQWKSSKTNQKRKSQMQKQTKPTQKVHAEEIFSRLQKIYGHSEEVHNERNGAIEVDSRQFGSRHILPSKAQNYQTTKPGKTKEQRKSVTTSRQPINAWK